MVMEGMGYSEGTGIGVRIVFAHMFVAFSISLWMSGEIKEKSTNAERGSVQ